MARLQSSNLRVLITDDHAPVRAGIRALLEDIEGVDVVAEVGDGSEAVRMIGEVEPDLVLLDISMPGTNGFEVLVESAKEFADMPVIVLTMHEAGEYAIRALGPGARGYVLKRAASYELESAIEAVRRSETYVSREVFKRQDGKRWAARH